MFNDIRDVSIHYAEKGDLLYPLLKVKYEISGPSDVMWTTDDEIRDDINALAKDVERGEEWKEKFKMLLGRLTQMIRQEEKVLFPVSAVNFTDEEWHGIYRDRFSYDSAFGIKEETWDEVKNLPKSAVGFTDKINMPTGSLSLEQLEALMDTIPMELTLLMLMTQMLITMITVKNSLSVRKCHSDARFIRVIRPRLKQWLGPLLPILNRANAMKFRFGVRKRVCLCA